MSATSFHVRVHLESDADVESQIETALENELQRVIVEPLKDHVFGFIITDLRRLVSK